MFLLTAVHDAVVILFKELSNSWQRKKLNFEVTVSTKYMINEGQTAARMEVKIICPELKQVIRHQEYSFPKSDV